MTNGRNGDLDGARDAPWYGKMAMRGGTMFVVMVGEFGIILMMARFLFAGLGANLERNSIALETFAKAMVAFATTQQVIVENQHEIIATVKKHAESAGQVYTYLLCVERARADAEKQHCFELVYNTILPLPLRR